jgi:deazaflavin-dependent oxidoreductase (nitroreductase family)
MQSRYGGVMRLPDQLARFNRHVTNPIQRMWAGKLPGFGIIEHVGRRSGKVYRTPVNTYRIPDGFAVFLVYGPDRDWVRNLNAAGRGRLVHRGRTYDVTDPTVRPRRRRERTCRNSRQRCCDYSTSSTSCGWRRSSAADRRTWELHNGCFVRFAENEAVRAGIVGLSTAMPS